MLSSYQIFLIIVVIFVFYKPVHARSDTSSIDSLEFSEFSKKISNIFDQNKIKSIISKLPAKFKIYGYDIGDINNDNSVDIVLSARDEEDKGKLIDIYFFLNQGDSFSLVKTFQLKYYGQPIEVAFSIEKGVCYITRKVGEYHWNVSGYKIENNIFRQIDKWETLRLNIYNNLYNIGYDTYDNFEALKSTEHFYRISDNKTYLKSSFYSLPVYPSHRHIPKLFPTVVVDTSASNILSGSSSWFGKDDLSFTISARYDSAWLFIHTVIEDDQLFSTAKPERQDTFELWFDISGRRKVDATYSSYVVRDSSAADIFGIKIAMGDQKKYSPSMSFISGRLKKQQASILSRTTFSVKQDTSGKHVVDIKLPMQLFTLSLKNGMNVGFTAAYRDIDNPLHPEWITTIATSDDFISGNPKTFGMLKFINEDEFYGDVYNLNINLLVQRMRSAGLM